MESELEVRKKLIHLKHALEGRTGKLNTTRLERDFLAFSEHNPKTALKVIIPKLYKVDVEEISLMQEALDALGIKNEKQHEFVDISGSFNDTSITDNVILFSTTQIDKADHYFTTNSYLNPLLEKIYTDGAKLITDFSIHEAICGLVTCKRGDLDLREAHIFPERFKKGPYVLSVELDTPDKTIKKYTELTKTLDEFMQNPKRNMLDPKRIEAMTTKAVELRKKLGALSRYRAPETQKLEAQTDAYIFLDKKCMIYYIYSPKKENIAVFFGENPFTEAPPALTLLNGDEHQNTLAKLVAMGIFDLSASVLEQKLDSFDNAYETISKQLRMNLNGQYPEFNDLTKKLREAKTYLERVINPELILAYSEKIMPELLEFMVCPSTRNPVIHELLLKLSWNETIREYHDTEKFIKQFSAATEEEKGKMLKEVAANILFNNQQNNNVNLWLYNNAQQFCKDAGINFEVIGGC